MVVQLTAPLLYYIMVIALTAPLLYNIKVILQTAPILYCGNTTDSSNTL